MSWVIILGIISIYVGLYFIKKLKGNIRINIVNNYIDLNQDIRGNVEILLKKPLNIEEFYVSLYAVKTSGKKTSYKAYQDKASLSCYLPLQVGVIKNINFTLKHPSKSGEQILNVFSNFADVDYPFFAKSVISKAKKIDARVPSGRWYIEARLRMKGLDLVSKKRIYLKGTDNNW